MMSSVSPVELRVYDVSHGKAETVWESLLRLRFDNIWHITFVVHNIEFQYTRKSGIQMNFLRDVGDVVGQCAEPMTKINMGKTDVDMLAFINYLRSMKKLYSPKGYNFLTRNCIDFTQECIRYLTGRSIPSWIKDLPSQVAAAFVVAPLRSLVGTDMVEEVVKRILQGVIETYKALKIAMGYLITPLERLFDYFWKFARKLLPRTWRTEDSADGDVEGWEL